MGTAQLELYMIFFFFLTNWYQNAIHGSEPIIKAIAVMAVSDCPAERMRLHNAEAESLGSHITWGLESRPRVAGNQNQILWANINRSWQIKSLHDLQTAIYLFSLEMTSTLKTKESVCEIFFSWIE